MVAFDAGREGTDLSSVAELWAVVRIDSEAELRRKLGEHEIRHQ